MIVSDGGPQYTSAEFKDFTKQWQIEHRVSSPRNPQSNGMAERCVQTMKASLIKTMEEGEDMDLALLTYKTTPPLPAELLNSRKYKSLQKTSPVCRPYQKTPRVMANCNPVVPVMDWTGPYHIKLKDKPVQHPPRSVPLGMQSAYRAELDRLVREGIITEVHEHTEWINSIVPVMKEDSSLRLCLDPKDLNKTIERNQWYARTLDDILPELAQSKYFTIKDATSGFWHILLDFRSSLLTLQHSVGQIQVAKNAIWPESL